MKTKALPFYEFNEGIYEIDEFDCASIFVIVGTERALVLDTGTGIGDLRWVIENRITDKPYDVVLSHNHGDHTGGAGFFDTVWVHEKDSDWNVPGTAPSLEFRRNYAELIRQREQKYYRYTPDNDILPWPKEPQKKILKDGTSFYLGGRTVTFYHCPGHTDGECVAIDNLTRTLLIADACNNNLLLGSVSENNVQEIIHTAEESLNRIVSMHNLYGDIYNSHHDFRGFGQPLNPEVLTDVLGCLTDLYEKKAQFSTVPDALSTTGGTKTVAVRNGIQIALMNKDIRYY